jgi:tetratricopeptide (TPR) repeat protein
MSASAKLLQTAIAHHKAERFPDAEKAYLQLIQEEADNADGLRLLGALYLQTGQISLAMETLQKAAHLLPNDAETLTNFGITLRSLKRREEAIARFQQALAARPDYIDALNNLGDCCYELGRGTEAAEIYERILHLKPEDAAAHVKYGNTLQASGQTPEAVTHYEQALKLQPHFPAAMNNLANILRQQGKTEQAVALYREALRLRPDYAEAMINLATGLCDLGRLDEAIESCRAALQLQPDSVDARINLGTFLQNKMCHEEALLLFDEALQRNPTSIDAQWNKALSLLALGQYKEGWRLHEVGLGVAHLRGDYTPERRWNGEDLAGKRLLIRCEQGHGDNLQFVRYAELCKARGAVVLVQCPPALRRLFANCTFIDMLPESVAAQDFDLQVPIMSLPYIFGTKLDTIPAQIPYLYVSEGTRVQWAKIFSDKQGFKVGLVWAGNPRENQFSAHLTDRRRSMELAMLKPLFDIKGVQFYNLQMGAKASQIATSGLTDRIIDLMGDVQDFEDTAAIIEHLDLVISVDTSVAHLAGGMGKPVWILSRFDACWRWLQNRADSPWYPAARIFGQQRSGDWAAVIEQVKASLAAVVGPIQS